jgi:hypothetical protein
MRSRAGAEIDEARAHQVEGAKDSAADGLRHTLRQLAMAVKGGGRCVIGTIRATTHELTRCSFLAAKRTRRKVLMRGQGATWTSPPPFGFCNIHFKEGSDLILKVRGFWPAGLLSIVNGWLFICAGCPPQVNTKFATPCISALSLTVAVTAWAALHVRTPPASDAGAGEKVNILSTSVSGVSPALPS